MALNLVTLNWDITDLVQAGQLATLVIAPTAQLSDATDHVLVPTIPRQVNFYGSGSLAGIVANDNSAITPSGTGYYISVITAGGQVIVPQMQVQILFSNGATQWLDALAPVPSVTTTYQYLPLPSGTPQAGQVPVATGSGETSAWGSAGGSLPLTTLGDMVYENATPAPARLAGNTAATKKFLTQTGTGSVSAAPGWNTIAAADMPAGTTSAQGALQLDGTAGDIQAIGASAAAGTSGLAADARHVHPNTGLVTIDATTGDIAAAPGTAAAGATGKAADAGHVHPQPPVLAPTGLTGATAASRYAGATASGAPGSGTFAVGDYVIDQTGSAWVCTAAGTPGTWKQVITPAITAADTSAVVGGTAAAPTVRTGTLDVIATQHPAAADWSNNSHKITSLANGSGAQDAAAFGQIPVVEGTVGNIKPVSTAAALGSSGKWPDSDHVHLGFFGGIFGNGSDGSVTFDGSTTILGMVPSGSAYTMTRDIQCANITVNNGVTLKTASFRIFCQGTLTNNGTISNAGNAASGSSGGGGGSAGSFVNGKGGGAGGTGVSGTGGNGTAANFGAAGGNGGAGTSGAAGTGGTVTQSGTVAGNNLLSLPFAAIIGEAAFSSSNLPVGFGAGGGGGGSDASSNAGGGGGGGGGVIAIFAWAVNNGGGTVNASGGAGATAAAGNAGGGGGGAGGAILVYTLSAWTAGTTNVAGGALGSGHGTGSNGQAGGNGLLLNTVLA